MITNAYWEAAPDSWFCPTCERGKHAIVAATRAGECKAKLVYHHDHFEDLVSTRISARASELMGASQVALLAKARHLQAFLSSFDRVLICECCNHAEAKAKQIVGAPAEFSFGPIALRGMRDLESPSGLNERNVSDAWLKAEPGLKARWRMLDRALNVDLGSWREPTPHADQPTFWRELLNALDERPGARVPPSLALRRGKRPA